MNKLLLKVLFGVVITAAVSLLTGCNGNEKSPLNSNKLNIRIETPANSLNPLLPGTGQARYVSSDVFQTLGYFDPQTLELMPLMIKAIPAPVKVQNGAYAGALAYEFELLDAVQWDNGTPVTAEDVAFTLKLVFNPLLKTDIWRNYFELLQGFESDASNPKKFTIYLKSYYFLGVESICNLPIFPAYHYDPSGWLKGISVNDLIDPSKAENLAKNSPELQQLSEQFSQPAYGTDISKISGCGPYQVTFFDPSQGAILVKKNKWWGDALAAQYPGLAGRPDTIQYKLVKAEDAAVNMLRTQETDVISGLQPANFVELQKDPAISQNYEFVTHWGTLYNRIIMNMRDPVLSDKNVRQALSQLVNYDELIKDVQQGLAQRLVGPVNPSKSYYAKDIPLYQFEVEKARALLAASGWTDSDSDGVMDKVIKGKKTDLVLTLLNTSGHAVSDMIGAGFKNSCAKAGVKIEIKGMELPTLTKETQAGNYQLAAVAAGMQPTWVELYQYYHSHSLVPHGDNRTGIAVPELDQLIEQIRTTEDPAARTPLYIKAQEILHDQCPEIFLYAPVFRFALHKRFEHTLTAVPPAFIPRAAKLKAAQ